MSSRTIISSRFSFPFSFFLFKEMEDNFMSQYQLELNPMADQYSFDDLHFQSFSSESYSSMQTLAPPPPSRHMEYRSAELSYSERPAKQLKSESWNANHYNNNNKTSASDSSSSQIISFEAVKPKEEPRLVSPAVAITRSPVSAQDHVMAERKRREKLSQRFIALSAVVPGLKKVRTINIYIQIIILVSLIYEALIQCLLNLADQINFLDKI